MGRAAESGAPLSQGVSVSVHLPVSLSRPESRATSSLSFSLNPLWRPDCGPGRGRRPGPRGSSRPHKSALAWVNGPYGPRSGRLGSRQIRLARRARALLLARPCLARQNGSTPLHTAASKGHTAAVDRLIAARADINAAKQVLFEPSRADTPSRPPLAICRQGFVGC